MADERQVSLGRKMNGDGDGGGDDGGAVVRRWRQRRRPEATA